ncbi:50S ribosomal protein L6 [Candidatus Aerophobetes bacterium]|uniref:50S ribosomal protein L6 n=1 Tax=Aerophobetes bacterium TaxID=2030807 RepID=A0A2A4X6Z3_UNCAE|nr:MAG: 50S ribosomal protein L6 [Candidatus Aerophobetes bacterium]
MSRLAKKGLALPKSVEVKQEATKVLVKGPKGQLEVLVKEGLHVAVQEGEVKISLIEGSALALPFLGLYFSLIKNAIIGVSEGFEKKIQLIGVGFRAVVAGNKLDLKMNFSHPCQLIVPSDLKIAIEKSTLITISGCDKRQVGEFAAAIRAKRPPEPYKGKGARYVGEYVRKKAGKTAKGK